MPSIENLTRQVVLIRMNSGREVNMGPLDHLDQVPDSEVRSNRMLEKLVARGFVSVVFEQPSASADPPPSSPGTPVDSDESDGPRRPARRRR